MSFQVLTAICTAPLGLWLLAKKLAETSKFQVLGDMVTGVVTQEKVVALTYDDGPNPPHTNHLLEVLAEFQVKATFFVVGQEVERHGDAAEAIAHQGHELGNHSYSHRRLIFTARNVIRAEINRTDQLLKQLGKASSRDRPIHFRSPYGYKRLRLPWVLSRLKKTNVLWNVDPRDYEASSTEAIVESVVSQVQPGGIVLLHDGGGDRSLTVAATAQLIPLLRAQGYRFATVSELLALRSG